MLRRRSQNSGKARLFRLICFNHQKGAGRARYRGRRRRRRTATHRERRRSRREAGGQSTWLLLKTRAFPRRRRRADAYPTAPLSPPGWAGTPNAGLENKAQTEPKWRLGLSLKWARGNKPETESKWRLGLNLKWTRRNKPLRQNGGLNLKWAGENKEQTRQNGS